ncbi:BAG family molecular chaperone regulator 2-like [Impatiens glandulifera]|uniref:BAG family molecular chaperone regulator 2-like n=1 Tax=Impatiens glandulifera TaxID=253017 RepID=UPI001FB1728F|nr:BAG family molecular chaperone regulator 2-like [Impatiens glandulifera]
MNIKRTLQFNQNTMKSTMASLSASEEQQIDWETRPGGMFVQRRTEITNTLAIPHFRVRVVHGDLRYEISVNHQMTFGEVKKLLTTETGLTPSEQRLNYRGKERENGDYLDMCGVKDRSKIILIEDELSRFKRLLELRRDAKIKAIHRRISDATSEIGRLAEQVSAIEKSVENGKKVAEVRISTLIEMLMLQAVKLDGISVDGELFAEKDLQGMRIQKCVESLDMLKVSNARIKPNSITTKWETFDHPLPPPIRKPTTTITTYWELFD